jgi:alkylated DNA repair protein alkB family protein 1
MQHLDPHERPPDGIRNVYKKYQKMKPKELEKDEDIVDLANDDAALPEKVRIVRELDIKTLSSAFRAFAGTETDDKLFDQLPTAPIAVYEHDDMPGNTLSCSIRYTLLE